ncbi:MAG TPA: hypothetical protein PLB50_06365 [Candidatus Saccharicenans sp.]|nr:hypothetical protein [Candidatus Saccharicenans sp.]HQO76289.1 hypothetical protein [Candidatus Saccharicenans sp.]
MSLITLFPPEEPRAKRSCGQRIQKGWLVIKQTASGFSGALLLSTAFHLFLAFLLTVTAVAYYPRSVAGNGEAGSSGGQPAVGSDFELFARAVDELNKEIGLDKQLARLMEELEEKKLPELAQNILIMDDRMTEKEKAIETWRKIEKPYRTYSIKNLLDVINQTPSARLYDEIELELNYQSAKNSRFLYRRQVQFDKWARRQKSI